MLQKLKSFFSRKKDLGPDGYQELVDEMAEQLKIDIKKENSVGDIDKEFLDKTLMFLDSRIIFLSCTGEPNKYLKLYKQLQNILLSDLKCVIPDIVPEVKENFNGWSNQITPENPPLKATWEESVDKDLKDHQVLHPSEEAKKIVETLKTSDVEPITKASFVDPEVVPTLTKQDEIKVIKLDCENPGLKFVTSHGLTKDEVIKVLESKELRDIIDNVEPETKSKQDEIPVSQIKESMDIVEQSNYGMGVLPQEPTSSDTKTNVLPDTAVVDIIVTPTIATEEFPTNPSLIKEFREELVEVLRDKIESEIVNELSNGVGTSSANSSNVTILPKTPCDADETLDMDTPDYSINTLSAKTITWEETENPIQQVDNATSTSFQSLDETLNGEPSYTSPNVLIKPSNLEPDEELDDSTEEEIVVSRPRTIPYEV